ncbi:hypothetical protein [Paenibacillus sp. sgz500958]|uniref:hypothetical protein n=1 Tax=Paenibacillus sp. sgz500958 TaxID=3242475 RepID=UPI0036D21ADA
MYDEKETMLALELKGQAGFAVSFVSGERLIIKVGKIEMPVEEWFSEYPPSVLFVEGSELDGNLLIEPKNREERNFPLSNIETWKWDQVNITKESQWKEKLLRKDSIQFKVIQEFIKRGFEVVIDDDDSGEAADVICISDKKDHIQVILLHCKYSGGVEPGQRVKDIMEVCGQASRSVKWSWKFVDLCKHISNRELPKYLRGRASRFMKGNLNDIQHYAKLSRFKPVKFDVYVVQPGLSKRDMTEEQINVLSASYGYILDITGVDLKVICSE